MKILFWWKPSLEIKKVTGISACRVLLLVGLLLVGMGTGGIKPCVATFGGDQFHLPEQAKQQTTFFSIFYWAVRRPAEDCKPHFF